MQYFLIQFSIRSKIIMSCIRIVLGEMMEDTMNC